MTPLGRFLTHLIEDQQIDAKTMAGRMGVDQAVLSRLMSGKRVACSQRTLRRIVSGCSELEPFQARCLAAYLKGLIYPPFDRRVFIREARRHRKNTSP